MQVMSKNFLFTLSLSLLLALCLVYVFLVYKNVKPGQRRFYMVGFTVVWTLFEVALFVY